MTTCPTSLPPLIRWPGGKARMSKKLIALFPAHDTYVEAFAGGASVFFAKPLAKNNVIADADSYPIQLYRDVRKGALAACDGGIKISKGLYHRAKKNKRACYKVALSVLSYHGDRMSYGGRLNEGKVMLARKLEKAECYAAKLRRAKIVRGDFAKVARAHDGCRTVHFWDPPWPLEYSDKYHAYGGAKRGKSKNKGAFGNAMDPAHVAKVGSRLRGTVVVIYNWTPELVRAFKAHGFRVKKMMAPTQRGRGGGVRMRPNMVAIKPAHCARRTA